LTRFCDTTIIHGDQDQNHPIDLTGRKTAQAISGSQFKVYEGAAHGLFVTHKEQLNRDLLTFIQN
jgi:non-heme chloroperoxidase